MCWRRDAGRYVKLTATAKVTARKNKALTLDNACVILNEICIGSGAVPGYYYECEVYKMKHIKTLTDKTFKSTMEKGGCGECQTSCQSACKTSCTVGNQTCENK